MGQHSHLYALAAWQARRAAQLASEPCCRFCDQQGLVTAASVVDHVERHEGDLDRFLNGPVQSLCKRCHDSTKQRAEKLGFDVRVDVDGFPIDPTHPFNRQNSPVGCIEGENPSKIRVIGATGGGGVGFGGVYALTGEHPCTHVSAKLEQKG